MTKIGVWLSSVFGLAMLVGYMWTSRGAAKDPSRAGELAAARSAPRSGESTKEGVEARRSGASRTVRRGIARDPADEAYDPVVIMTLDDLAPSEIFRSEPRVAAFSGPRETFLAAYLERSLADREDVEIARIECRASSCEIELRCAAEQTYDVYTYVQRLMWGTVYQPAERNDGDTGIVTVAVVFAAELRNHDAFQAWHEQATSGWPRPDDPVWGAAGAGDD